MRKKELSRVIIFVLIIALVSALTAFVIACGGNGDTDKNGNGDTTAKTIKVGSLFPVSGDLAKLGQECVNATKLAFEEINAAGGIKSMGGAKLQLVEADSQGKPDVGIQEVERLAQEGVVCILGTYQSSVAIPATQAAERLQVPIFIVQAIADEITEKGYKYTFRLAPKASWYAKSQVEFAKAMPDLNAEYGEVKTAALLHEDTDFGQSTAAGDKKYMKELGIELVSEVAYPAAAADLTTQVSKVKASNPDIIFMTTYLNDAILINQAREKMKIPQLFVDSAGGTIDPEFIKRLGESAEGICTVVEFSKYGGAAAEDINKRYEAKFNSEMSGNSCYAYQGAWVLAKVLENAGSDDREKIREAFGAVKLDAAAGDNVVVPTSTIEFGPDGQVKNMPLYVCQIQGGELVPLFPTDFAMEGKSLLLYPFTGE
ncbi:MAG: ABC transporter substrate-binding protein [Actinobacteria bacterium]|nr:ABC transporter substrate-binding protein [Actinomycetota bacterium]